MIEGATAVVARGDWPLVGRRAELGLVLDALADEGRAGVAIAGSEGVGKSRLLAEAALQLHTAGRPTRWLPLCRAGAATPLAALAQFTDSHRDLGLRQAMHGATAELRELSRTAARRAVVVADDACLLDEASTAILHTLAREGEVALLLGLSDTTSLPTWVQALADDTTMARVELQPLDRAGVAQLAIDALSGPISAGLAQELWRLSRGSPRVLRALLDGGQQEELLAQRDGQWRDVGPLAGSLAVCALLAPALDELTDSERTAVELLAVAGGVGLGLVARLVGNDPLGSLEQRGIVEIEESGARAEVRIANALLSESVRLGLTWFQHRCLARRLSDALEAVGLQREDDVRRAATWRLDGGRPPDVDVLLQSSAEARARLEPELAERFARSALQQRRCWRTHLHLAQSLSLQGEADEADRLLVAAADYAHGNDARLHLATARADNLLFADGRSLTAVAVLDDARTFQPATEGSAEVAGRTAIALGYEGDAEGCVRVATELPSATDTDASGGLVLALAHGLSHLVRGDVAGALAAAEQALVPSVGAPTAAPLIDLRLRQLRLRALLLLGRFTEAEQIARADHDTALADATADHVAATAGLLGLVLLQRGQAAPASELLADACGHLRVRDPLSLLAVCCAARAYAAALLGETEQAATLLDEARHRPAPLQPLTAWAGRAACWLLVQQGDIAAATEEAVSAATDAHGPMLWHAEVLHDVARLGHADTAPQLTALARVADSDLITSMAAHASSITDADPHALHLVADRFSEIGADLLAAEAHAQAAAILRATGHPGPARHAAARAAIFTERCGAVSTPALTRDLVRLTAREREVALLAADGLSSREVAERLSVSVRTVDNHLHRAYGKLGITRRAELSGALHAPGPASRHHQGTQTARSA